jgi:hypothetical protein
LDIDDDTVDVRTIDWANTKNYDKDSLDDDVRAVSTNKKIDEEDIEAVLAVSTDEQNGDIEKENSDKDEVVVDMDISDVRAESTDDGVDKSEGWDGVDILPIGRPRRSVNKTIKIQENEDDDKNEGKTHKLKNKKLNDILNKKSMKNKSLHGPNAWVVVKWVC